MIDFSDREREWISRKTAELASRVPPPGVFLEIAKRYSEGRISALRYDPASREYRYKDMVTNEEKSIPESKFQERAAMVCRRDDGTFVIKPLEPLLGQLGAPVNKSVCYPDRPVGVIHTHPAGASFPSAEDLTTETDPDIHFMCVGSKQRVNGGEVYPVLCFYRYSWVDRRDIHEVARHLDRKLNTFLFGSVLKDTLRLDVYDKNGIRFTYIFPPPLATRYLVSQLKNDPVVSSVFDIDYRVWDQSDISP